MVTTTALSNAYAKLEERVLSRDANWNDYAARVRYRLVPFVW